jgi:N-acetylmuramic acid 6-phosphate etherase
MNNSLKQRRGGVILENYFAGLTTEEVNLETMEIDECSTDQMLRIINQQDMLVPAAVKNEIPNISIAVDIIYNSLKDGGKLFYIGAGTSGRLGVLDASECPPTFGTDPEMVQGHIAGGDIALRTAVEGCEDDFDGGAKLVRECGITAKDVVVGITASGSAPFVLGALEEARICGAATIGIVNNYNTKVEEKCDICIAVVVGPEVITGSTRLKSGTAQKLVLNMLTTTAMIKLGKVYGNMMVDLKATNKKLLDRAKRIVSTVTGVTDETAAGYLDMAQMNAKLAIMMIETGLNRREAEELLEKNNGRLKEAIRDVAKKV